MTTYQITSPLAMCACGISAGLSVLLLVEPSFHAGLTPHLIVPVAVSVGLVSMAIITGVLAHGHGLLMPSGAALALVSVGLSGAIVWEQSGRRAQTRVASQTAVVDTTKERARLTQRLAEAEEILVVHRKKRSDECVDGNGKRCRGSIESVKTWEAAVAGYQAMLRGVPSLAPDAKAETIGTAARLSGYDADTARAWVSLIDPLLVPLLLELAAILCGVVAFGPKDSAGLTRSTRSTVSAGPTPDFSAFSPEKPQETPLSVSIEAPANENAESLNSEKRLRHSVSLLDVADEILEPIVIQRGGRVGSQAHLAKLSGLSEGTVSKMLKQSKRLEQVWDHHSKCNVVRLRA